MQLDDGLQAASVNPQDDQGDSLRVPVRSNGFHGLHPRLEPAVSSETFVQGRAAGNAGRVFPPPPPPPPPPPHEPQA